MPSQPAHQRGATAEREATAGAVDLDGTGEGEGQGGLRRSASGGHPLARMLLQRILLIIPTVFLVSVSVFVLTALAPGDPAILIAGEDAPPEAVAAVRASLDLDAPLPVRYGRWLSDTVRGDLGNSLISKRPVRDMIARGLPVTLSLTLVAMAGSVVVAMVWGTLAAWRKDGIIDRSLSVGSSVLLAVPSFFLALVLVSELAVKRQMLPAVGYRPFFDGPVEWLRFLIIPSAAAASVVVGELARQLRGSLRDALERDYVLLAHAKGLGSHQVVLKHAMRNALIPVLTVLGTRFAALLGGTVLVEQVCGLPGLGSQLVAAVRGRDLPVVIGIAVVTTLLVLVVNLLIDLSYGVINPKLRSR